MKYLSVILAFLLASVSEANVKDLKLKDGNLVTAPAPTVGLVAAAYYNNAASCVWDRSGVFGGYSAVAACPAITVVWSTTSVDTTDNDLPDIVFPYLEPGFYEVTAQFEGNGSSTRGYRIVLNGLANNVGSVFGEVNANVSMTNIFRHSGGAATFAIQGTSSSSAQIDNANTASGRTFSWIVKRI